MLIHTASLDPEVRDTLVLWKTSGRLGALSVGGYETRHDAVVDLVVAADREHGLPELGPVLVHTLDRPVSPAEGGWRSYAFCTADGFSDVAVPDFVFGGWPQVGIDDFDETAWALAAAGDRPAEHAVVGWIGSVDTSPLRRVLHGLGQQHPDLLDVQHVAWAKDPADPTRLRADNALTLPEQAARWGALLDLEGKGYSGRLKLLLHSGRPVLVADRPWREWFAGSMVPMEHYVPVRRDLSDLVEQARWVQQHPHEAAQIGRAGQKLAQQLLTRAGAVAQWAQVLQLAARPSEVPWAPQPLRDRLVPLLRDAGAPV